MLRSFAERRWRNTVLTRTTTQHYRIWQSQVVQLLQVDHPIPARQKDLVTVDGVRLRLPDLLDVRHRPSCLAVSQEEKHTLTQALHLLVFPTRALVIHSSMEPRMAVQTLETPNQWAQWDQLRPATCTVDRRMPRPNTAPAPTPMTVSTASKLFQVVHLVLLSITRTTDHMETHPSGGVQLRWVVSRLSATTSLAEPLASRTHPISLPSRVPASRRTFKAPSLNNTGRLSFTCQYTECHRLMWRLMGNMGGYPSTSEHGAF